MKMGIDPITVSNIVSMGDYLYVTGENFTTASKIFINGNSRYGLSEFRKNTDRGRYLRRSGDEIEVIQMKQPEDASEFRRYVDLVSGRGGQSRTLR